MRDTSEIDHSVPRRVLYVPTGKYSPHQNSAECRRRLKQVRAGKLTGGSAQQPFVSEQVRYAAHGLIHPAMRQDGATDR